MLYAYYTFSYVSKLPGAEGKRVDFEGCSMMQLRDGLIADYREVANVGPAFVELGFRARTHLEDPRQGRRASAGSAGVEAACMSSPSPFR